MLPNAWTNFLVAERRYRNPLIETRQYYKKFYCMEWLDMHTNMIHHMTSMHGVSVSKPQLLSGNKYVIMYIRKYIREGMQVLQL